MAPRLAYSLFMLLGLTVFLLVRRSVPKPAGVAALPWTHQLALAIAAFIGGVFGAKLPFVFASAASWWSDAAWLADGKTIMTGLGGAYLAVEVVKWFLGIHVKTGDTFALPLALAMAVGRWGCFCNGCCYGVPTTATWGVDFGDGVPRHPTQIYESLFHATMACVILYVMLKGWIPTHRLQLYLIAYCVYRFATEYIRPEPEWWLRLTFYQWAALALASGLALQWWYETRRANGSTSATTSPHP